MTDLNCDETVAEHHHQRRPSVDTKTGLCHHQTPSVIVQLPNFYNLKTNKKFAAAYDSNSEDSLGKPPHDILSSDSDKVLSSHNSSGGGVRPEILDSSKLLLCYSSSSYNNSHKGGGGQKTRGPTTHKTLNSNMSVLCQSTRSDAEDEMEFRFSGLPETEEMDRNLMHIMVDGGGSEIFKDEDVLKADKDDSFSNRCGGGERNDHVSAKDELQEIIHGKIDGGSHAELSFNFTRSSHGDHDDDDRVLKRRELGHFEDVHDADDDRRMMDSDLDHSDSNRDRHEKVFTKGELTAAMI